MARALTDQLTHANSTLTKYGWDDSQAVAYHFDNRGFRVSGENTAQQPDILFFGGSTSFGIGVSYEETYPYVMCNALGKSFYNLSYAQHLYNNALIYATACQAFQTYGPKQSFFQWVSDKRLPETSVTVYEYINQLNKLFPDCLHIMIDGLETGLQHSAFSLINPPWMDSVANNTHPGPRTHEGIAKFLLRKTASHAA